MNHKSIQGITHLNNRNLQKFNFHPNQQTLLKSTRGAVFAELRDLTVFGAGFAHDG